MEIYTEAPSEATRDALRKLSDWLADCCCRLLLPEEDGRFPESEPAAELGGWAILGSNQ